MKSPQTMALCLRDADGKWSGDSRTKNGRFLARLKEYPDPEAAFREMASTQLNGRMAKPEEVAAAALYLAADESAKITGTALMIDGGWTAGK